MRNAAPLSLTAPPENVDVPLPGCAAGCPWEPARQVLQKAVDPAFVAQD
jgi:hypothetical protein